MNIVVNTQALAQELRLMNQVVPTKPSLPILMNVLIQAGEGLRFAVTDLEVALRTTCAARVVAPGAATLPVKRLLDIVEQMPDAEMQITTEGAHVHLQCGAFRGRLQTMTPDDFPVLPETAASDAITLPAASLRSMVSRIRYAIADKSKFLVKGALLTLTGTAAALVATDGKRLALATMPFSAPASTHILPAKTLDALLALFSESASVTFSQSERHLFFQADERTLLSRTIDTKFPSYERIIPRENDKKATVDRMALVAALCRVGQVAEDNGACYLSFAEGLLDIHSSSALVGDAAERVVIHYSGEPLRICCNWQYLIDFLDVASDPTITLELKDDATPILLTEGNHHLAVVMLMRP